MEKLKITESTMIDLLGGTNKVARMCQVASTAVTQWRKNGIPHGKLLLLAARIEKESHGLVTRQDMFPGTWHFIWPELLKRNTFGLQEELNEE
jgi:DNA-binding transcriptional regulator YdaS (Cro superfamily)